MDVFEAVRISYLIRVSVFVNVIFCDLEETHAAWHKISGEDPYC